MSQELKPCPFCGGSAQIVSGAPGCHYVRCEGCGASGDDRGLEKAISIWNRRSTIAEQAARIAELEEGYRDMEAKALGLLWSIQTDATVGDIRKLRDRAAELQSVESSLTASRAECEGLRADKERMTAALKEAEGELYQVPPADAEQERVLAAVRAALSQKETGDAA